MKKQNLLLILTILMGGYCYSQNLTCADFKTGKFYIPVSDDGIKKYTVKSENSGIEEHITERDADIEKYVVIRENGKQIEWKNGFNIGTPEYEIIKWLDSCTYRLTYDDSKTQLSEEKLWVNENNGIVVKKVSIKENCMDYLATMTTNDGREISQKGRICKE